MVNIVKDKIKLYFFSSTRADYGVMRLLIKKASQDKEFSVKIFASGTHLSQKYGCTCDEIEKDNFAQIVKVPILDEQNDVNGVSKTMANALVAFSNVFSSDKPDFLFVDGDRYETLAVVIAAVNNGVKVIHNAGGCITEGAIDDYYRHAITKLSILHFTSTNEYRKRIIQMGEQPNSVFVVGSLGIESILNTPLLSKKQLCAEIGLDLNMPFALVTYHPVTTEPGKAKEQVQQIITAISNKKELSFIITGANADVEGENINSIMAEYCKNSFKDIFIKSMGSIKYLSAMKYCEFVLGNSSSGIIEAPSFKVPTINVGNRQKGRIMAKSVVNCEAESNSLIKIIDLVMSKDFRVLCCNVVNPYERSCPSTVVLKTIKQYYKKASKITFKHFYDIV